MSKIEKMAFDPFDINNSFRFHHISEDQVERLLSASSVEASIFVNVAKLSVPKEEVDENIKEIRGRVESHNSAESTLTEEENKKATIEAAIKSRMVEFNPHLGSDATRKEIIDTALKNAKDKTREADVDVRRTNSLLHPDLQHTLHN